MANEAIYHGRLMADGHGNLLADERTVDASGNESFGEDHGKPVAYHEGSYIFLKPGEPSHNERHSENVLEMAATQSIDPDLPGYAGTEDAPTEGNEHHFGVLEDDDSYEEGAELDGVLTNTRLKFHPDSVAAKISGHTDSGTEGGE